MAQRVIGALLALAFLLSLAAVAPAEEPPAPNPDRVRYTSPDAYRSLDARLGDAKAIQGLAAQLTQKDAAGTLRAIWLWARKNLRLTEVDAPTWRSVSDMIRAGTRTGDAEAALAIGALARAASIPTVWVKTVSVAWLKGGANMQALDERTFLELHLDGGWRLLDPVSMRLYERYDPKSRLLPGNRLAFDKGGDPYALVLPNRSALYRAQVAKQFKDFDVKRLPWGASRDLLAPIRVYVAGGRPVSRYVTATCETMGYLVEATVAPKDFARVWPQMRGRVLIVTAAGNQPQLPKPYWTDVLPAGAPEAAPDKHLVRRLADGTVVIYTGAQSYAAVEVAVARALSELGRR